MRTQASTEQLGSQLEVTPSILTVDYCELGRTLDEAAAAGINWFHMDVMDGNWVVNKTITFGPALIRSARERLGPEAFIDCHLMVNNAEESWDQYVDAGVDMVIAHIEAVDDFPTLIDNLHSAGVQAGCVLNPDTPVEEVMPLLPDLDLVLVMSVVPGKGGQSFMPEVEGKVRAFRAAIDSQEGAGGKSPMLMIDGGIKDHNAATVSGWGIDIAVVGSGLINDRGTIAENLESIHSALAK
jgi:ribulose-phosphate 3-epimerase